LKIFITGAEIRQVDDLTYTVFYKDKPLRDFDNRSAAVMFGLSIDCLEKELQLRYKSA